MFGFVADYDTKIAPTTVVDSLKANQSKDFPVGYSFTSRSGGVHLVWEFETPIQIPNPQFLEALIHRLVIETQAKKLLPALDKQTSKENIYYTLGRDRVSYNAKVSHAMLCKIIYDVCKSKNVFKTQNNGTELPFEIVQAEIEKKWPGRWQGPYAKGSRGLRFWDAAAKDTTACEMHETGCYVFSSEEAGFKSWREILGASVVSRYEADRIAQSVGNLYYDGKNFYDDHNGNWNKCCRTDVVIMMKMSGLSSKGSPSEIDSATHYIIKDRRVEGMMPFIYQKDRVVNYKGKLWINSSKVFVHEMSDTPVPTWGDKFPHIAGILNAWWGDDDEEQLSYFLAWCHLFYKSARQGTPQKGQALFLAGGASTGKTLFSTRILSLAMGGHSDISNYIQDRESFNENIFQYGLATIDDDRSSSDYRKRQAFAANLKKFTANHDHQMRKMYQGPTDITWKGRIIVTTNTDADSIQILPSLDISNRDKVMFFKIPEEVKVDFPIDPKTKFGTIEREVRAEIPYFLRWLFDYVPNPEVLGDPRFGTKSYIHPELEQASSDQSLEHSLEEMLYDFRKDYFNGIKDTSAFFTATQLLQQLSEFYENKMLEGLSPLILPKRLNTLISRGASWLEPSREGGRRGFLLKKEVTK
jgi:hypothetical protein